MKRVTQCASPRSPAMTNRQKIARAVLRERQADAEPDLRRLQEAIRVNDPELDKLVTDIFQRYPRCEELEAHYARVARRDACEQGIGKVRKRLNGHPEAEAVIAKAEH